jgi:hypothetical protein
VRGISVDVEVAREAKCGGSRFLKANSCNMAYRHHLTLRLRGRRSSPWYLGRVPLQRACSHWPNDATAVCRCRGACMFALAHGFKKVLLFREEALGASGCVVPKAYRRRSYKDSAREYRFCDTVGPLWLAGKEAWWCGGEMESGCWTFPRLWFLTGVVMSANCGVTWGVSVLCGLGSAGPGYIPKYTTDR